VIVALALIVSLRQYDQQAQMPKSPKSAIKKMFKKRHRTIDNRAALMVSGS
jgi:hypothetical protein